MPDPLHAENLERVAQAVVGATYDTLSPSEKVEIAKIAVGEAIVLELHAHGGP